MQRRVRQLLLFTTALAPFGMGQVLGNPLGPQVVAGTVQIQGLGTDALSVQQSSDKAIVNWGTFDIGRGESTTIVQPGIGSVLLNRVTGGLGASQILGTLNANGQVFLINPDGVLFGKNATVDVGALVVTTHDLFDSDFLSGNYEFGLSGSANASVVNLGTISVSNGGFAALVAPGVRNDGVIRANLGKVALASGNSFSLDLYGDGLIKLAVNDEIAGQVIDLETGLPLDSLVANNGLLRADGGTVQLTAAAAREVLDSVINNSGVIEANTIGTRNGKIVLSAQSTKSKPTGAAAQKVTLSGQLSAVGADRDETGGRIEITGEEIVLTVATIDAFGWSGGGTVLIGGDVGGGNVGVANAVATTVDALTSIDVSASVTGNGGKVVVWSDEGTRFAGTIRARGGAAGGDGGFVELSGREALGFAGVVDAGAPAGKPGVLLLDPQDISIGGTGAWVIDPAAIEAALAVDGSVVVMIMTKEGYTGQGDINVNTSFDVADGRLFLVAHRNITLADGVTIRNYGDGPNDTYGSNLILASGSTFDAGLATLSRAGSGTVILQGSASIDFLGEGIDGGAVLLVYDQGNPLTNQADFLDKVHTDNLDRWMWIGTDTAVNLDDPELVPFVPGDLSSWEIVDVPANRGRTPRRSSDPFGVQQTAAIARSPAGAAFLGWLRDTVIGLLPGAFGSAASGATGLYDKATALADLTNELNTMIKAFHQKNETAFDFELQDKCNSNSCTEIQVGAAVDELVQLQGITLNGMGDVARTLLKDKRALVRALFIQYATAHGRATPGLVVGV
jgi:filamentous hemagglutinin family protein